MSLKTDQVNFLNTFNNVPLYPLKTPRDNFECYRLFLTTNEMDAHRTLEKMAKFPVVNKVMLSVSGLFGLNAASIAGSTSSDPDKKIEYLVVLDKGNAAKEFWAHLKVILIESPLKETAIARIQALIIKEWRTFYAKPDDLVSNLGYLKLEVDTGASFLSDDTRYGVIRKIFIENHFVFLGTDLCQPGVTSEISKGMQQQGLKFHMVYTSNIREYVEDEEGIVGLKLFRQAMGDLKAAVDDATLFIDTKPRENGLQGSNLPCQRVYRKFSETIDRNPKALEDTYPESPKPEPSEAKSSESKSTLNHLLEYLMSLQSSPKSTTKIVRQWKSGD